MSVFQTSSIDSVRHSVFFTSIVSGCAATVFQEVNEDEESEAGSCGSTHPQHGDSWLPQDRLIPGEPSVHLDNGTFWSNRAAVYSGKPHRAVFEDSLSKIYKNLYRNASQPGHGGESSWTQ
ncbi:spermatogenesis-associated protein 6 isoform X2 [Pimephales promelas]|uniref:spermatogenesis-associated protein 6 isoform X2 n=1 Tax=Pimephales promelas TaxID=90988 RepID=UPI001955AAAD|nr:spermatogenesis-associated protein 6 isoform X2 [Pimephales promelas]